MHEQIRPQEGTPEMPPAGAVPEQAGDYKEKASKIAGCHSFGDLYEVLHEIGPIKGKDAESIIVAIKTIEGGAGVLLNSVTREFGLRAKVKELFEGNSQESKA